MPDGNNATALDAIAGPDKHLHALTPGGTDELDLGERLPAALERDIRWFLFDPPVASVAGGSGGFGAQLERAESFGFGAIPCRKCGGVWRQRRRASDGEPYFSEWRDGTGWFPSTKFFAKTVSTYARALTVYRERQAKALRLVVIGNSGSQAGNEAAAALFGELAAGQQMVTKRQLEELFPSLPPEVCKICDGCRGIGVVPRRTHKPVEVTARPTGSSVGKAGRSPDEMVGVAWEELHRYRGVERLLERVAKSMPLHRVVLAAYYGPAQDGRSVRHLAERGKAGGFEALWPLTPSARDWLDGYPRRPLDEEAEAIRKRAGVGRPEKAAPSADDAQGSASVAEHAGWLTAVKREAWALYGAACGNANAAAIITGYRPREVA